MKVIFRSRDGAFMWDGYWEVEVVPEDTVTIHRPEILPLQANYSTPMMRDRVFTRTEETFCGYRIFAECPAREA